MRCGARAARVALRGVQNRQLPGPGGLPALWGCAGEGGGPSPPPRGGCLSQRGSGCAQPGGQRPRRRSARAAPG
eukprot:5307411-Lingulodinium_polyedra.AAC.1